MILLERVRRFLEIGAYLLSKSVQLDSNSSILLMKCPALYRCQLVSRTGRILVIDDNVDAAFTLAVLVKLTGYEARTSGQAGIEAARELQPSAILLDVGMPQLDRYETSRLLREQSWGHAMVVIALTGYGQAEYRQRTQ